MCLEYKNKLEKLSSWELNNNLPLDLKEKTMEHKINYLIENYKLNNPIYVLFKEDLMSFKSVLKKSNLLELKSLNLDPRYLESMGFNEKQIESYFDFTSRVKALLLN